MVFFFQLVVGGVSCSEKLDEDVELAVDPDESEQYFDGECW